MIIGCHLSSANGFYAMGLDALKIDANTFQFFTRNPRGSKAKEIDPADVQALLRLMEENNFPVIMAHAPYTLNPCSIKPETRDFARITMEDDLKRMEAIPGQYYNFHPGCHTGQGVETGITEIITLLNSIVQPEQTTTVLLETMAGKGTEIGSHFEELAAILDGCLHKEKFGVCLDTCHVYDAGYDIVNHLNDVLEEFDKTIGCHQLKAIHLNDSKNPFSSHKDRHERLGKGSIGLDAFKAIVTHPTLSSLPFYLETPSDLAGYQEEIKLMREFANDNNQ